MAENTSENAATGGNQKFGGTERPDSMSGGGGRDYLAGGEGDDTLSGDGPLQGQWRFAVYDRDFTSDNGQAGKIESGKLAGQGYVDDFRVSALANAMHGTTGNPDDFGVVYTSTLNVGKGGSYRLTTASDDGSTIVIRDAGGRALTFENQEGGKLGYLNNDYHQSTTTRFGDVVLESGQTYTIEVRYWENLGENGLAATISGPDTGEKPTDLATSPMLGTPPPVEGQIDGDDTLDGGMGNDVLIGGGGDDVLIGGAGNDLLIGGTGDDRLLFGAGDDTVYGGDGNDVIDDAAGEQLAGANEVHGGAGNDTIWTGDGADTVSGDAGDDRIFGEGGDDALDGGDGNDRIEGGAGADRLIGSGGDDRLSGGEGADSLDGGAGDDLLSGGAGSDRITTGEGGDFISGDSFGGGPKVIDVVTDFDPGRDVADFSGHFKRLHDMRGAAEVIDGHVVVTLPDGASVVFEGVRDRASLTHANTVVPCFAAGARIATPHGPRAVETIRPGDLVLTEDEGPQPVLWAGQRHLDAPDLSRRPDFSAVLIPKHALGPGRPAADLRVSPQHRILLSGWRAELVAGVAAGFAPAAALIGRAGIRRAAGGPVTYVHLMFGAHQVIRAEGLATESLLPTARALGGFADAARDELLALFPALRLAPSAGPFRMARPGLRGPEARCILAA